MNLRASLLGAVALAALASVGAAQDAGAPATDDAATAAAEDGTTVTTTVVPLGDGETGPVTGGAAAAGGDPVVAPDAPDAGAGAVAVETDAAAAEGDVAPAAGGTPDAVAPAAQPEMAATEPAGGYGAFGDMAVADIVGRTVRVEGDDDIGEVEELVMSNGEVMAIVGVGGFLGMGEHDVLLPLSEFEPTEDALTLGGYSEGQLRGLPAYAGGFDALPRDMTVSGDPVAPGEPVVDPAAAATD